jgi:hypothetical protein
MGFHLTPLPAGMLLKPPGGGVEGITDRDVGVFVLFAGHRQFRAGRGDVYMDAEKLALMLPALRFLDHDPALMILS